MTLFLLIIYYFFDYRKSFPIIVSILLILNNYVSVFGVTMAGIGVIEVGLIFTLIFFVKSIFINRKLKNDRLTLWIIVLLLAYFFTTLFQSFNSSLSILQIYKSSRPLIIELFLFSGIVYFKKYGTGTFYEILFWGTLIHLLFWLGYIFIIPDYILGKPLGLDALHSATVGLASAYIIAFLLVLRPGYLKKPVSNSIVFIAALLPLLGMSRGGIIAVLIVFVINSLYRRKLKSLLLTVVILPVVFLIANYTITNLIPREMVYRHLGSNSLFDLINRSEDIESISQRIIRWDYAMNVFADNPIFGGGFSYSTIGSGMLEHKFKDLWQAHNYYLSILAGGGLFLFSLNLVFVLIAISASVKVFLRRIKYPNQIFAVILVLNVININLTNNYFKFFWSGPYIWLLFIAGLYELSLFKKTRTEADRVIKQ